MKAGNFKKFDVFLQMLASAFDNDSESVYVDVLTYTDLEMLKARKGAPGGDTETITSQSSSRSQTKRYVILTYRGEFDRVHYPLPLSYEATPNADSLQRTIRRLRNRLQEADSVPQTDLVGEKDLRKIIANLRQENTELKHRIRRQGSGGNAKEEEHVAGLNRTIADLQSANGKQRKEVEGLNKELSKADATYQKYRTEAQKEINRWKTKSLEPRRRSEVDSPRSETWAAAGADRTLTNSLRKRVAELERELRLEKLSSSRSGYTGRSPSTRGPTSSSVGPPRRAATPPMSRPYSRGTPSSAGSARSYRGPGTFGASNRGRSRSPNTSGTYRKATVGSANGAYRGTTPVTARSRSISPGFGSSVGGRFDPTAYQKAKEAKAAQSMASRAGWGASSPGSTSGRRSEGRSGYDSQDSADFRSGSATRSRRVSSRPHASPAAISATTRPKKKVSSSAVNSMSKSGRAVTSSGGEVRKDRKVRRGAEKSAKTTTLKSKKEGDGSIGSFPMPVDDIPVSKGPGADLDGSLVEDSPPLSKSPAHRSTQKSPIASPLGPNSPNKSREDIQAIDARIASLQQYLESARTGLLSDENKEP